MDRDSFFFRILIKQIKIIEVGFSIFEISIFETPAEFNIVLEKDNPPIFYYVHMHLYILIISSLQNIILLMFCLFILAPAAQRPNNLY